MGVSTARLNQFQSPIGWGLSCESGYGRPDGRRYRKFQSPIGWGLSCELLICFKARVPVFVSIPYWLGSKLRGG
mgnify:CR=1 FL=1